jgi:hypothetical protein
MFEAIRSATIFLGGSSGTYDSYHDPGKITRIQLQRLLDSDQELLRIITDAESSDTVPQTTDMDDDPPAVRSIRALDIIRKYKSRDAMNKKRILDNLVGSANFHTSETSSSSVRRGLIRVLDDTESDIKTELTSMIDTSSRIAEDLIELKNAIDGISINRPSVSPTRPAVSSNNDSDPPLRRSLPGSQRFSDDTSPLGRNSYHIFRKS